MVQWFRNRAVNYKQSEVVTARLSGSIPEAPQLLDICQKNSTTAVCENSSKGL
jgi:hypothetical protein